MTDMQIYMQLSAQLEKSFAELVQSLQTLVRIKSVNAIPENGCPFGRGVYTCLEKCLLLGKEFGFLTKNMEGICGYVEYGEGKEMVAVLTHLDVVPEGDGWQYPAYGAEIVGEKIYGRGTVDDKGPAVAAIYALKAIKDSGVSLQRRIRVIFGCDEETENRSMTYYRSSGEELPTFGFAPDAGYPIINGEKGSLTLTFAKPWKSSGACTLLSLHGGSAANLVPDTAEAVISFPPGMAIPEGSADARLHFTVRGNEIHVYSHGTSAHAANPQCGENAIGRLILWLDTLPLQGEERDTISFLAQKIGMENYGESLNLNRHDDLSGNLTLSLGWMELTGGDLRVCFNIRTPVTASVKDIHMQMRNAMTAEGFSEKEAKISESLYITPNSELIHRLSTAFEGMSGRKAYTRTIGGETYAKMLPNVVAFGPNWPGEQSLIHCANENIELEKLKLHTKITAAAMYELAK